MRPRVMLAWEGGAGRGHAVSLARIAQALGEHCTFDAAMCRLEHASVLEPHCELVFQGAGYITSLERRPGPARTSAATWADHLGDIGFSDPDLLIRQIRWWLAVFQARASTAVVADFAPCATLAAHVAGLTTIVTGTGYLAPPAGLDEFPVFLPEYAERHHDEPLLLDAVNTALAAFGTAPLSRFSDIYCCNLPVIQTIAAMDPFVANRTEPYLPPIDRSMPRSLGGGDEIFIYFSTDERDDLPLLTAIESLGAKVRLFMSNIPDGLAERMTATGVKVERAPMPFEDIARRSRMTVNAGQHGSLCAALGMGLPQLAIPRHLEHLYHARRAADLGSARVLSRAERDPAAIRAAILEVYESPSMGETARELSASLAPDLAGPLDAMLRDRLVPLLA